MKHETTLQTQSEHYQILAHIHTTGMVMHTSYTRNVR